MYHDSNEYSQDVFLWRCKENFSLSNNASIEMFSTADSVVSFWRKNVHKYWSED